MSEQAPLPAPATRYPTMLSQMRVPKTDKRRRRDSAIEATLREPKEQWRKYLDFVLYLNRGEYDRQMKEVDKQMKAYQSNPLLVLEQSEYDEQREREETRFLEEMRNQKFVPSSRTGRAGAFQRSNDVDSWTPADWMEFKEWYKDKLARQQQQAHATAAKESAKCGRIQPSLSTLLRSKLAKEVSKGVGSSVASVNEALSTVLRPGESKESELDGSNGVSLLSPSTSLMPLTSMSSLQSVNRRIARDRRKPGGDSNSTSSLSLVPPGVRPASAKSTQSTGTTPRASAKPSEKRGNNQPPNSPAVSKPVVPAVPLPKPVTEPGRSHGLRTEEELGRLHIAAVERDDRAFIGEWNEKLHEYQATLTKQKRRLEAGKFLAHFLKERDRSRAEHVTEKRNRARGLSPLGTLSSGSTLSTNPSSLQSPALSSPASFSLSAPSTYATPATFARSLASTTGLSGTTSPAERLSPLQDLRSLRASMVANDPLEILSRTDRSERSNGPGSARRMSNARPPSPTNSSQSTFRGDHPSPEGGGRSASRRNSSVPDLRKFGHTNSPGTGVALSPLSPVRGLEALRTESRLRSAGSRGKRAAAHAAHATPAGIAARKLTVQTIRWNVQLIHSSEGETGRAQPCVLKLSQLQMYPVSASGAALCNPVPAIAETQVFIRAYLEDAANLYHWRRMESLASAHKTVCRRRAPPVAATANKGPSPSLIKVWYLLHPGTPMITAFVVCSTLPLAQFLTYEIMRASYRKDRKFRTNTNAVPPGSIAVGDASQNMSTQMGTVSHLRGLLERIQTRRDQEKLTDKRTEPDPAPDAHNADHNAVPSPMSGTVLDWSSIRIELERTGRKTEDVKKTCRDIFKYFTDAEMKLSMAQFRRMILQSRILIERPIGPTDMLPAKASASGGAVSSSAQKRIDPLVFVDRLWCAMKGGGRTSLGPSFLDLEDFSTGFAFCVNKLRPLEDLVEFCFQLYDINDDDAFGVHDLFACFAMGLDKQFPNDLRVLFRALFNISATSPAAPRSSPLNAATQSTREAADTMAKRLNLPPLDEKSLHVTEISREKFKELFLVVTPDKRVTNEWRNSWKPFDTNHASSERERYAALSAEREEFALYFAQKQANAQSDAEREELIQESDEWQSRLIAENERLSAAARSEVPTGAAANESDGAMDLVVFLRDILYWRPKKQIDEKAERTSSNAAVGRLRVPRAPVPLASPPADGAVATFRPGSGNSNAHPASAATARH